MPRYRIEQQDERWVIVHPRDAELIWCGSHWGYCDQSAALVSFATREQAEHYAVVVLGR